MKRFEKIMTLLLAASLAATLFACGNGDADEYTALQKFEYHFYPEEYEEEYGEVKKEFTLEADTDYRVQVSAECESGTMEIRVSCGTVEDKIYLANPASPCDDTIFVPANMADFVSFTVTIQPDTEGIVAGELSVR